MMGAKFLLGIEWTNVLVMDSATMDLDVKIRLVR
jgi:hypothetical protein